MKKILFLFLFLFVGYSPIAQKKLDSLWSIWNNENQADTSRLIVMNNIIWKNYMFNDLDSALILSELHIELASSTKNKKWLASSYNLKANVFKQLGDLSISLKYHFKCLKIHEENDFLEGVASTYINIANINSENGDDSLCLSNNFKSLKIFNELGIKNPTVINNIGVQYSKYGNFDEALKYYNQSLSIGHKQKNKRLIAIATSNIGDTYAKKGQHKKGIEYIQTALTLVNELDLEQGKAICFNYLANIYLDMGEINNAISYYNQALDISIKLGIKSEIRDVSNGLYESYKVVGNHSKALEMHEIYIKYKDSIINEKNTKSIIDQKYKYEYEKKTLSDSIFNIEEAKIKEAEHTAQLHEEKIIRYGLLGVLVLIILFFGVIINRLLIIRKQKNIIKKQKAKVDYAFNELNEKNNEILASINYAKRIQDAILPENKMIMDEFKDSFIFYHPKDVVGGDFYWHQSFGNKTVIATVDCTGHGVPGGFMSMMGSLLLDKIIHKKNLDTSAILTELNNEIIRVLKQDSGGEIQDGMDIALCLIDKERRELHFSGARNGIIIFSNNEIKNYHADLFPVGGSFSRKSKIKKRVFIDNIIPLIDGDWIFMYTDGYYDQLGGAKVSSLGMQKFESILKNCIQETDKNKYLLDELNAWKGSYPQIDDLLVMGFSF